MSALRPLRAVLPELDASDCGCDGKAVESPRGTTHAHDPRADNAVDTEALQAAPSIVVGCLAGGRTRKKGSAFTANKGIPVPLTPDK